MKVTIKANNFCPDDCKYCALKERLEAGDNGYLELVRYCNNEDLCRHLFEVIKAQYDAGYADGYKEGREIALKVIEDMIKVVRGEKDNA